YQALIPTKKATSVFGEALGLHDPATVVFRADVDADEPLDAARAAMFHLLEGLPTARFSADEVERAKSRLLKEREKLMAHSDRLAVALGDWQSAGDWRLFFLHRDQVAEVRPADVERVASRYFQHNNCTVGLYIPTSQPQRTNI